VNPSTAATNLTISQSRSATVVGAAGLLACLGFALLLLGAAAMPWFDPESEGAAPLRVAFALIGLGAAWMGVWIFRYSRGEWTRGQVIIDGDAIRIEHPDSFKQPLVVPRRSIRVGVVDRSGRALDDHAPMSPDDEPKIGWGQLPFIASHEGLQRPNVGLLFDEPVPAPEVNHQRLHGPLQGEALAGLRVRVDEPERFRHFLADWGSLRRPAAADVARVEALLGSWSGPSPPGARRPLWLKRLGRQGWLMVPVSLIVPWVLPIPLVAGLILIKSRRYAAGAVLLAATVVAAYVAFGVMRS
jgi:hypothetical protein